jgi:hypothetical protein
MKATSPLEVAFDCANGKLSKELAICVLVRLFGYTKEKAKAYLL